MTGVYYIYDIIYTMYLLAIFGPGSAYMQNKDTRTLVTQGVCKWLLGFANEVEAHKIWFGHEDGTREEGYWHPPVFGLLSQ